MKKDNEKLLDCPKIIEELKQIKSDIETTKRLFYRSGLEDAELHVCKLGHTEEWAVRNAISYDRKEGLKMQPVNKEKEIELLASAKGMAKLIIQMEKYINFNKRRK